MILMNGHYKKNVNPEVHQDDELRDFLGLELTGLTELTVNSCFFYTNTTVTPLAACAPITNACSISAVLEGPLMKMPKLYFGSISMRA